MSMKCYNSKYYFTISFVIACVVLCVLFCICVYTYFAFMEMILQISRVLIVGGITCMWISCIFFTFVVYATTGILSC